MNTAIGETPDLFAGATTAQPLSGTQPLAGRKSATKAKVSKNIAKKSDHQRSRVDHLAVARKLQWQLRKTRSHSPEEVKTGRLICRHLLALLNEAEPANQEATRKRA